MIPSAQDLIYYLSGQGTSVVPLVPPTRDEILSGTSRLQGIRVKGTEQYGDLLAFGPEINMLDVPADRVKYYAAQRRGGTNNLVIGWAGFTYTSGDGFTYPVPGPGYRWVNDLPGFCDRLFEILTVGGFVGGLLCLPGDGHTGVDGNPFGYQWLMANLPNLINAMESYPKCDLTKFFIFNPGFDGVVWNWTETEIVTYGNYLRNRLPNCYSAIEYGAGIIGPFGEGKSQYDGPLRVFDKFLQEAPYPPESNMDQSWQIGARLLGPKYNRPSSDKSQFAPYFQPNDDDPGAPFAVGSGNDYLSNGTPRGKYYTQMWETLTYGWVRGFVSDGTIDYWNKYYVNLGWNPK